MTMLTKCRTYLFLADHGACITCCSSPMKHLLLSLAIYGDDLCCSCTLSSNVQPFLSLKIASICEQIRVVLFVSITGFLYSFVELVALIRYVIPRFTIGCDTMHNWLKSPRVTIHCQSLNVECTSRLSSPMTVSNVAICTGCGLLSSSVDNA